MKRKSILVVQARMSSSRLPGKVLADLGGQSAIALLLGRVAGVEGVDAVWLACSDQPADDPLAAHAETCGVRVFRGDETDVLGRFASLARQEQADDIIRITGDCPFADPQLIAGILARHRTSGADFTSNTLTRSYPDGLDVEVISRTALEEADARATHSFLREHVTPYIHGRHRGRLPCGEFRVEQVVNDSDFSHLRWTLDEPDDLEFFRRLLPLLKPGFTWQDVLAALLKAPQLLHINGGHQINEGGDRALAASRNNSRSYQRSNEFFERASNVVPLASQTFSKSHQQWVRGAAPLFLESGRGARVVDLDGNSYIDYVLGLLPNILGYRDPDVDLAIMAQLEKGITFSLATRLEAEVAEQLCRLIPCAEMVRFGKNGSDVTSAAVRLARAFTGRDRIGLCGYHGWHDWYIGTTTRNSGVPAAVQALSAKLPFNDLDAIASYLEREGDNTAAIIMEPDGAVPPAPGFLAGVRALTERHGVLLVFDEIITGFRVDMGGAQRRHGVTPDLACFGKSMANGMPISAIVGPRRLMRLMEDIFFSATFGGEALSLAAVKATLDKLERDNVVPRLWRLGERLRDGMNAVFARHGLGDTLKFSGEGWWPRLAMLKPPVEANLLTSLLRQEFCEHGLLLGASLNLSLAHDNPAIERDTLLAAELSIAAVRAALDAPDPAAELRGEMIRPTFSVR